MTKTRKRVVWDARVYRIRCSMSDVGDCRGRSLPFTIMASRSQHLRECVLEAVASRASFCILFLGFYSRQGSLPARHYKLRISKLILTCLFILHSVCISIAFSLTGFLFVFPSHSDFLLCSVCIMIIHSKFRLWRKHTTWNVFFYKLHFFCLAFKLISSPCNGFWLSCAGSCS